MARAQLDKQPADVARMFDEVAKRYDLTNDVLSLGQDRRWRKDVIEAVDPQRGDTVLDLAAGTGTSSQPFADRGASVVPCDFSLGMLQVGKRARPHLPFTAGDGTQLPFADDTFDAVTISFGLRNIVDPSGGAARDAPGHQTGRSPGRLRVQPPDLGAVPHGLRRVPHEGAATGGASRVSSSPDAYVYLAESIRAWPDQQGLADLIAAGRLAAAGVAQPQRRDRRAAPRHGLIGRGRP